jgi:hypothetical protein
MERLIMRWGGSMSLSSNIENLLKIAQSLADLPPEEIGGMFAKADSEYQAKVLHAVALTFKSFNGCMQNCMIAQELTPEAKHWLDNLHQHTFKEGV